ncbi:1179_t:CDS:2, partial [Dentiscutata erythropus]
MFQKSLTSTWKDYQSLTANATANDFATENCQQFQDRPLPKFPFLAFDNLIFIMFQAFQLYFCFNAIFHEHIIQILTITLLNFCWALYGTVQAVEVKISLGELDELSNCVNKPTLVPNFWGNDIPCVVILLIFAFIMSYLSYKLYKQFGWWQARGLLTGFIIFHMVVTIMVLILEILAYRFVATEHRVGMIVFLVLWLAVIVDFVFAMLLFAFGVRVVRHFGQGLKEILDKNEVQQEEPPSQNPGGLVHIWDDLEFEP